METKLLRLLKDRPEGLTYGKILTELSVPRKERTKVLEALKDLEGHGLVRRIKSRYMLAPGSGLVRGRFSASRRGFGFVTPETGGEDVFIPPRAAGEAVHGDTVEVRVRGEGRIGKPEGHILRILKRGRERLLGIYKESYGQPFVLPLDVPSSTDIAVQRGPAVRRTGGREGGRRGPAAAPKPGMIVEIDRKTRTLGRALGYPDDEGVDTQVVISRFGLAAEFQPETLAAAAAVPGKITAADLEGRRDFRDWPTVTIDGEKAQDFDDAVGIRPLEGGGWLLAVHIADVSHYVRPGEPLDVEAYERGTSVYLPGRTLPMLPERLSNDLCSLRPREPRLTMSVLMEIDPSGLVRKAEFAPSIIQTVERMTYTTVFAILEDDKAARRRYKSLVQDFLMMRDCARALRGRRMEDGSLDFDLVEPELVTEEGKCLDVIAAERNEAHRLIEDFMVAANVAVASFLTDLGRPYMARVHAPPSPADLEDLRSLLSHFEMMLPAAEGVRSRDLQRVLERAEGRPDGKFIAIQVLRSMKLAVYAAEDIGHYGLGQTTYAHFTSPIRRYPDLTVHRVLKRTLRGEPAEPIDLDAAAAHASSTERNAADAERMLVIWRILRLLKTRLGDVFEGIITDISKAGPIIELDNYFVDGLLPFAALGGDYFVRQSRKTLKGRALGRRFDLGDRIRVAVAACDPVLQRLEFALPEDEDAVERTPAKKERQSVESPDQPAVFAELRERLERRKAQRAERDRRQREGRGRPKHGPAVKAGKGSRKSGQAERTRGRFDKNHGGGGVRDGGRGPGGGNAPGTGRGRRGPWTPGAVRSGGRSRGTGSRGR